MNFVHIYVADLTAGFEWELSEEFVQLQIGILIWDLASPQYHP